jgi:hypothetical protein
MTKIFLVLSMTLFLTACTRPVIYDTHEEFFEWTDIENLGASDTFDFVYVYNRDVFGTECPGCEIVRDDLADWFNQNDDYTLYLVNERTVSGIRPTGIRSAPTLMFIYQGKVAHRILGAGPILEFLNQLDDGSITIQSFILQEED